MRDFLYDIVDTTLGIYLPLIGLLALAVAYPLLWMAALIRFLGRAATGAADWAYERAEQMISG